MARGSLRTAAFALFLTAWWGCSGDAFDTSGLAGRTFLLPNGSRTSWTALRGRHATVLITLDPDCPFTQNYAPVIDSLANETLERGVRFVGIYPSTFIDPDSAAHFARWNGLDFPQVMDPDCALCNTLHARVVPECFLLDPHDRLVYHGAIDDQAVRTGRHKVRATKHYLAEAIDLLLNGPGSTMDPVEAVGCIVECAEEDP